MIYGKIQQVITMKIYGPQGEFLGERARYVYKPILLWRDVIFGLAIALFILHRMVI